MRALRHGADANSGVHRLGGPGVPAGHVLRRRRPADDVWAAIRLIYFFRTKGEDLRNPEELERTGLDQMFSGVLPHVFGPPENRPTASDLLDHGLHRGYVIPSVPDLSMYLRGKRGSFLNARDAKHPGAEIPDGFWDDVTWRRSTWATGGVGGSG